MSTHTSVGGHGPEYTGHVVLDASGEQVGTVIDVLYDDAHGLTPSSDPDGNPADMSTPTWLVVDPGLLRASHYVPVAGSYRTDDGTIVAGFDKAWIAATSKATGDHVLTPELLHELTTHYSLG